MLNRPRSIVLLIALASLAACAPDRPVGREGAMGRLGIVQEGAVPQAAEVCAGGETVFGIDVSKWQGDIDWPQVAGDGVVYAFIRVTHGVNDIDEKFAENWAGARDNGILRGAYQYFSGDEDALAQAELFVDLLGPLEPGDLPPVIDVEDPDPAGAASLAAKVEVWIDYVQAELGVTPIIYTGKYFWQDNVASGAFSGHPLWHAQYPSQSMPGNDDWIGLCPNIANQWDDWTFWQYASTGVVAGITANTVDVNRFNGDMAALQALTVGDPVCGDGYCTPPEDNAGCPDDCPVCEPVPAAGAIIDDDDLCFVAVGNPAFIRQEAGAGYGGSLQWTGAWENPTPENVATWELELAAAGDYELEVYTDAAHAQWVLAPYQVRHDGDIDEVLIDQTAVDGWQSLGVFTFAAGGDQWVQLEDLVVDLDHDGQQIVWDALRITPALSGDGDGDGDGDAPADAGVDEGDAGSPFVGDGDGDGDAPADAGVDEGDAGSPFVGDGDGHMGDGDTGDGGVLPPSVQPGCACVTSSSGGHAGALAIVLMTSALLGRRRRRR